MLVACGCGCGESLEQTDRYGRKRARIQGHSRTGTGLSAFRRYFERSAGAPNDCWDYVGRVGLNGYGRFGHRGKSVYAHRFVFEEKCEKLPVGYVVRHVCDNAKCVNPAHLEMGRPVDNVHDTHKRKTGARCLSEQEVLQIRELKRNGKKQSAIAMRFCVNPSHVSRIVNRKVRKDVTDLPL